ncbi:MAG TPA: methyltransferase type 12 [Acidimicrobiaceae bacterium]|nr:methyltransferase type 12 [Acidimicrobiaceae bacterium]
MNPIASVRYRLSRRRRRAPAERHWVRIVMDREVEALLRGLGPASLHAAEISGDGRGHLGWQEFTRLDFPDFDLVNPHDVGQFDVVVCEQVLEHVTQPFTAATTLAQLTKPGGHVLVSVPFLLRVHEAPIDAWRFTPTGLRLLLESAGLTVVTVGSWGNPWCVRANLTDWMPFGRRHQLLRRWSLANNPETPMVVWALAGR